MPCSKFCHSFDLQLNANQTTCKGGLDDSVWHRNCGSYAIPPGDMSMVSPAAPMAPAQYTNQQMMCLEVASIGVRIRDDLLGSGIDADCCHISRHMVSVLRQQTTV